MKLRAAYRLIASKSKRRVIRAASELELKEGQFDIKAGGNSYRFGNPADAYTKAAQFIKQIEHDGFKFSKHGVVSDKMDVFQKGGTEISISVRNAILNIDLW